MATKSLKKIIQHEAYRIVFWQLVGVIILAVFALILRGITSGFSVLAVAWLMVCLILYLYGGCFDMRVHSK